MKRYNYLQAIYMSFFSKDLYKDVVKNWGGGVVLYLFILLLICWSVTVIRYQPAINASFKEIADKYSTQLPKVTIDKGKASTPENKPYVIKDPDSDEKIAVIDTSGKYKNISDAPEGVKVLVTKEKVYYVKDNDTVEIQTIPQSLSIDINPEQVKTKLVHFVGWSWVFFLPVLLFLSLIYRLIQVLIYAVIGKVFAAVGNIPLSYSNVLKITFVAITPAIVLSTILDWFIVDFPLEWLMYFIISMAYMIFGIRANK